jgi:putative ABC transport system ATP-binding protein
VHALRDINIDIHRGEFLAVTGPSGSGKSTLLHMVGCLDRPDSGAYFLAGRDVATLSGDELAEARNRRIGFVFQSYNLLPRMSALDNVALPLIYRGLNWREARMQAGKALREVGAAELGTRTPGQLSGGQQQRLSIARAIVGEPDIILADEPTGALERNSGDAVMRSLQELNGRGQTLLIITHDPRVAAYAPRRLVMEDGRLRSAPDSDRETAA